MTNDEKNLLMQPLYKIAEHNGFQSDATVTFKKRSKILDALKEKDEAAWTVISAFIDAAIKLDRITNDKEKKEKNNGQWNSEIAGAEKEKIAAEEKMGLFFRGRNIAL